MIITLQGIECKEYEKLLKQHRDARMRISLVKERFLEEVSFELGLNVDT